VTLLSYAEAAVRAQVSEKTLRRRVADGELPAVREGTRTRIRPIDLDRLYSPSPVKNRSQNTCRVIAVANQKGGVGKTSTCANLAAALSDEYQVLAVDCDPQGNLTQALGPNPDTLDISLYNVLVERTPIRRGILNPVLGHPGLSLIGANLELAGADPQLAGAVLRELRLRQTLEPVLQEYDFVILDCPPTLGLLTINALMAATEVIIPVEMGVFSLRGVAKLLDTVAEVRVANPGLHRVNALANRTDNTNLTTDVQAELQNTFGADLFRTMIRRSVKIGESQAARLPITLTNPKDRAAVDYAALANEVKAAGLTDPSELAEWRPGDGA